jgi:hypothetical protein
VSNQQQLTDNYQATPTNKPSAGNHQNNLKTATTAITHYQQSATTNQESPVKDLKEAMADYQPPINKHYPTAAYQNSRVNNY